MRVRRHLGRAVAGVVAMAALTSCSSETAAQWRRFGLLEPASDQAPAMGNLWVGAWIASLVIGVLVWGLIFYAIIRYRRRPGNEVPRQTKYHLPMEILYTLVPFLIIGVLFFFTIRAQNTVLAKEDAPPHTINVVAQKWSWTFNYMEQDNPDVGATVHTVGTMSDLPTLVLPVGETVRFNLASADVIHSFWIPAFYFKLDVIPGHPNSFDVTPSKIGDYDGKCAELCGTYHANMLFKVKVVSVDDYNAHLKKLASEGKTGEILPPAAATHLPSTPTASATKEEGE
ncbi:aa3-type cytochrome oxidase subunit II [Aestuariimicrobium ganziense]